MNLFDVQGKNVIVTGAGKGIGRSIALGFAKAGANIVVCSRTLTDLESLQVEIEQIGERCLAITCDVSKVDDIQNVVCKTKERFGKIDVLINNAGITKKVPAIDFSMEDWQRIIDVNLTGVFLFAQLIGREMIQQRSGKIINISSVASEQALKGSIAYAASKGGVNMLTKTLAVEWAGYGVQVNGLAPAYVETPLVQAVKQTRVGFEEAIINRTPMKRLAKPEEMVGTCIFLASDASSYLTGETIFVDGGWRAYGL